MQPSSPKKISCQVCGSTRSTGFHFGVMACAGCKRFFMRMRHKTLKDLSCSRHVKACLVTEETRTSCQFCRYNKCLQLGMRRKAAANQSEKTVVTVDPEIISENAKTRKPNATRVPARETILPHFSQFNLDRRLRQENIQSELEHKTKLVKTEQTFCPARMLNEDPPLLDLQQRLAMALTITAQNHMGEGVLGLYTSYLYERWCYKSVSILRSMISCMNQNSQKGYMLHRASLELEAYTILTSLPSFDPNATIASCRSILDDAFGVQFYLSICALSVDCQLSMVHIAGLLHDEENQAVIAEYCSRMNEVIENATFRQLLSSPRSRSLLFALSNALCLPCSPEVRKEVLNAFIHSSITSLIAVSGCSWSYEFCSEAIFNLTNSANTNYIYLTQSLSFENSI